MLWRSISHRKTTQHCTLKKDSWARETTQGIQIFNHWFLFCISWSAEQSYKIWYSKNLYVPFNFFLVTYCDHCFSSVFMKVSKKLLWHVVEVDLTEEMVAVEGGKESKNTSYVTMSMNMCTSILFILLTELASILESLYGMEITLSQALTISNSYLNFKLSIYRHKARHNITMYLFPHVIIRCLSWLNKTPFMKTSICIII